jgi:hypothetical protein
MDGGVCSYTFADGCQSSCVCKASGSGWSCTDLPCTPTPPPPCLGDGGLYAFDVPDSGIGDTGATFAGCLSCLEDTCPLPFMECSGSCPCQQVIQSIFRCAAGGTPMSTCWARFAVVPPPTAQPLLACAVEKRPGCLPACGIPSPTADAGATD